MKTGIAVCDAMTHQPVYVGPQITLKECANIMQKNKVGSLLVKDKNKLLGIFTERDMVRKSIAFNKHPSEIYAKDIMVEDVVTISSDKDIFEAIHKMKDHDIRHLPVLNDNGKFVGFLTLKDILRIQPQLFESFVDIFNLKEASRKPIPKLIPKEGVCQGCGQYSDELESIGADGFCPNCSDNAE